MLAFELETTPIFVKSDAFLYDLIDSTGRPFLPRTVSTEFAWLKYLFVKYPVGRDRVVQLYPPASPYIKKSFEGILTLSYIIRFTVNPVCARLHTYNSRPH